MSNEREQAHEANARSGRQEQRIADLEAENARLREALAAIDRDAVQGRSETASAARYRAELAESRGETHAALGAGLQAAPVTEITQRKHAEEAFRAKRAYGWPLRPARSASGSSTLRPTPQFAHCATTRYSATTSLLRTGASRPS